MKRRIICQKQKHVNNDTPSWCAEQKHFQQYLMAIMRVIPENIYYNIYTTYQIYIYIYM